jgi:hypothetical protein
MAFEGNAAPNGGNERLAKALGWFSIGLGMSELFASSGTAGLIGIKDDNTNRTVLRAYGLREIAAGIGILAQPRPAGWMWGRVAGDVVDIASLACALASRSSDRARVTTSLGAVLGVTALDVYCGTQLAKQPASRFRDDQSRQSSGPATAIIAIDRPGEELYSSLRDFMRMRGESGESRVFTSGLELGEDPSARRLRWRARPGAGLRVAGSAQVEAASAGRGSFIKAQLDFSQGVVARVAGKLFGLAGAELLQNELRKFKQLVETGEIATSDASLHTGMHPAQPPLEIVHA